MPLPLREYYPLERAAELLECTVDDLFHWASFGYINLCIKLKNVDGVFEVRDWRDIYNSEFVSIGAPPIDASEPKKNQLYFSLYNIYDGGGDELKITNHESLEYTISKKYIELYREKHNHASYFCNAIIFICEEKSIELLSDISIDYISDIDDFSITDYIVEKLSLTDDNKILIKVKLDGMFVMYADDNFFWDDITTNALRKDFVVGTVGSGLEFDLHSKRNLVSHDNLFILRSDFLKIKEASKEGKEIYIDEEVKERKVKKNIQTRTSKAEKIAIKALIANHHPEIKGNPAKVAEVLAVEARQAGLGDVNFDKNTVSNWLKES
ncbi:hypothetical protein ID80_000613 [Salmonella enterica subsp. enterica serovar Ball]|nr:hypothetical protein [Salmonella enterica subsp. enterica serovar Minnesota]EDV5020182.1 hypothetical protein [Salmonella enterica subsp. enterica serovar Ball]